MALPDSRRPHHGGVTITSGVEEMSPSCLGRPTLKLNPLNLCSRFHYFMNRQSLTAAVVSTQRSVILSPAKYRVRREQRLTPSCTPQRR
jgi:hypothetical protein